MAFQTSELPEGYGNLLDAICRNVTTGKFKKTTTESANNEIVKWDGWYLFKYIKHISDGNRGEQLDKLLREKNLVNEKNGWKAINKLCTEGIGSDRAELLFKLTADAQGISYAQNLELLVKHYDHSDFNCQAFKEGDNPATVENIRNKNKELKNAAAIESIQEYRYRIEHVEGNEKWLDPYNFDEIPLVGREKERETLDKFVNHPGQFKIWAIAGPSGSGKTRLACQWAYDSVVLKSWDCRILHKEDRTEPEQWTNWSPDRPTLIIIDYLFGFEKVIVKLMGRRLKPSKYKIRLLLLDHVFLIPLHSDKRWGYSIDGSSLNRNEKYFFDLKPLDLEETEYQKEIIKSIIAHRANIDIKNQQIEDAHDYLLGMQGAYHPLFAALIGDAAKSGGDFKTWNRRELIYYYLTDEKRLPWENKELALHGLWASYFIAVATARSGVDYKYLGKATSNCDSAPEHFADVKEICQKVVTDKNTTYLKPFEPDILGESFFLEFLKHLKFTDSSIYQDEFQQVFMAGDDNTQTRDAIEFTAFIQRLTRNLLNDNQSDKETRELWNTLFEFMNPSNFENAEPIKWAVTVGLVDIVDAINDQFSKKEVINLLNKIDPIVFYRNQSSSLLWNSVFYSMRHFELTSKLTKIVPKFSDEMSELFGQYTREISGRDAPLEISILYGFSEMTNTLMDHYENVKGTFVDWERALMCASLCGQVKSARRILGAVTDINVAVHEDMTVLKCASFFGHADVVRLFLDNEAKIDATDNKGRTALHYASIQGHLDVVKQLLNKNANVDVADGEGLTALMCASLNGHVGVVKLLLHKRAKINITDNLGRTAFNFANFNDHAGVTQLLLDRKIMIDIIDNES